MMIGKKWFPQVESWFVERGYDMWLEAETLGPQ